MQFSLNNNKAALEVDYRIFYKASMKEMNPETTENATNFSNSEKSATEIHDSIDINIPARSNFTPLRLWASQPSSSMLIQALIDLGAEINAQGTDDQASPLSLAAYFNNNMATRRLLEHGADANIDKTDGYTLLLWSFNQGLFNIS